KVAPTRTEIFRKTAGPDAEYRWMLRTPNSQTLRVSGNGGPLRVPELRAPGHALYIDGVLMKEFAKPVLATEIQLNPGEHKLEWRYEPMSYRVGLYGSAIGLSLFAGVLVFGLFHKAPAYIHLYEERAADPKHGRALLYSDLEVARHSHAEDGKADT
ncbi:MAG: hypothetical protein ABI579_02870, partial [Candidatus Sumerlaeota bacterium]